MTRNPIIRHWLTTIALLAPIVLLTAQVSIRERRGDSRAEVFERPPKLIVGIGNHIRLLRTSCYQHSSCRAH